MNCKNCLIENVAYFSVHTKVISNFRTTLKMILKCKNCLPTEGIEIPDFTLAEKCKLEELTIQSPLHTTKYIIENLKLSHRDAKYIVTHINRTYGKCNLCNFDNLDEEYINCPQCGALNFNWKTRNRTKV